MSLEFNKVVDQVEIMGRHLGYRNQNLASRLELAIQWYYAATDLAAAKARIDLVRKSSVSGYRGAAAMDEIICASAPTPARPEMATLVAVDGSQIYPDQHAPALYYLVNTSAFITFQGITRTPVQYTKPELCYTDTLLLDNDGRLVSNLTVNARRSLAETQLLAAQAEALRDPSQPVIGLYDGGLLRFFGANEVVDAGRIERDYMQALGKIRDEGMILGGYLDRPRSTYIISLLHLLHLEDEDVSDLNLKTNGELEGLMDVMLMSRVLEPGERSAIMVQNSPQNREYKDRDPSFEIAFFYMNVAEQGASIARVDIPMWVARDKRAVNALHAMVLAQCAIQGRRHYPYALTRADELAYVSGLEKNQLNELINIALLNNTVEHLASGKLQTKGLARSAKQQHKLGSK